MDIRKGKRNKQAASILNTLDLQDNNQPLGSENLPIGMKEDVTNNLSANFGTERDPEVGRCIVGNGNVYVLVPGILSTDSYSVWEGSDDIVLSDGRIDIPIGNKVYGLTIDGKGFYKLDSLSETTIYDSSGNGNHGTIVNYYDGFWGEQNIKSWQDDVGFTATGYQLQGISGEKVSAAPYNYASSPDYTLRLDFMYESPSSESAILGTGNSSKLYTVTDRSLRVRDTTQVIVTYPNVFPVDKAYSLKIVSSQDGYSVYVDNVLVHSSTNIMFGDYSVGLLSLSSDNRFTSPFTLLGFSQFDGDGNLYMQYSGWEGDATKLIDNSGNGRDATITLGNEANFIDLGYHIPRDESQPHLDVLGNPLQYKGLCPARAKYVESPCFKGDGVAYLSGDVLTTDTITAGSSDVPTCTIDGRLDFTDGVDYWDVVIERAGSIHTRLTMSECKSDADPSNFTIYDVS